MKKGVIKLFNYIVAYNPNKTISSYIHFLTFGEQDLKRLQLDEIQAHPFIQSLDWFFNSGVSFKPKLIALYLDKIVVPILSKINGNFNESNTNFIKHLFNFIKVTCKSYEFAVYQADVNISGYFFNKIPEDCLTLDPTIKKLTSYFNTIPHTQLRHAVIREFINHHFSLSKDTKGLLKMWPLLNHLECKINYPSKNMLIAFFYYHATNRLFWTLLEKDQALLLKALNNKVPRLKKFPLALKALLTTPQNLISKSMETYPPAIKAALLKLQDPGRTGSNMPEPLMA